MPPGEYENITLAVCSKWVSRARRAGCNSGGVELSSDGGESKPSQFFCRWRRIQHADPDKNQRACDEHCDRVVQIIRIHDVPDHRRGEMVALIQHFKNESRRAEDKSREKRRYRSLAVQTRPQNTENKASGDRGTDVGLNALEIHKIWPLRR